MRGCVCLGRGVTEIKKAAFTLAGLFLNTFLKNTFSLKSGVTPHSVLSAYGYLQQILSWHSHFLCTCEEYIFSFPEVLSKMYRAGGVRLKCWLCKTCQYWSTLKKSLGFMPSLRSDAEGDELDFVEAAYLSQYSLGLINQKS